MVFEVTHITTYTYSRPVFLEPHHVRLRPRCDAAQRLSRFDISVIPRPAGRSDCLDLEGNGFSQLWFDEATDRLHIEVAFAAETLRTNPFDFLIIPSAGLKLPMVYAADLLPALDRYRQHGRGRATEDLAKFAENIAEQVRWETVPFLSALAAGLSRKCEVIIREEGDPFPPGVTLGERRGSCRDLAVLFIYLCRVMGFAARFVSGYQQGDPDQLRRDLHAWAEVYLPGPGWRGYDPSLGLTVADRHVAVAAASSFRDAAPVSGTFRGTDVTATLRNHIVMRTFEEP
jgi:transglutaminase-like putative cysteine protease